MTFLCFCLIRSCIFRRILKHVIYLDEKHGKNTLVKLKSTWPNPLFLFLSKHTFQVLFCFNARFYRRARATTAALLYLPSNCTRLVEIQKVPNKISIPDETSYFPGCKNIVINIFQSWPFEKMAFKVHS